MAKFTVVVTDDRYGSYEEEKRVLGEVDARLLVRNLASAAEAKRELAQADAILANLFPLTAEIIESLPKCRVISRYGVGYDSVDVPAATRKGIWVARVPDYAAEEVTDHAVALLLGCARKIPYRDKRIREGAWDLQKEQPCHRIAGRTLGIVGYGTIGRRLHRKLSGFDLGQVLVHDPLVDRDTILSAGALPVDLPRLLQESDFISLHTLLNEATRRLIGAREIALMRPTAILINTSRGAVIDEPALVEALRQKRIAGAGLDVFETEPPAPESPLYQLENVILSDHAAWYSEESMSELKTRAAQNVAAALTTGRPQHSVNELGELDS